jgi:hypothetical protein
MFQHSSPQGMGNFVNSFEGRLQVSLTVDVDGPYIEGVYRLDISYKGRSVGRVSLLDASISDAIGTFSPCCHLAISRELFLTYSYVPEYGKLQFGSVPLLCSKKSRDNEPSL